MIKEVNAGAPGILHHYECGSCGANLTSGAIYVKKDWKYCPVCSAPLYVEENSKLLTLTRLVADAPVGIVADGERVNNWLRWRKAVLGKREPQEFVAKVEAYLKDITNDIIEPPEITDGWHEYAAKRGHNG